VNGLHLQILPPIGLDPIPPFHPTLSTTTRIHHIMALTIKHLNSDASFLLSFEPVYADPVRGFMVIPKPFTILLDPWITGPSKIFHSKISITTHKNPPCISSLAELPEPDLVIISQHKSDHCNEATLRQLPATGTKTLILAEPASARLIKSWKYFDQDKIRTIERWEDPRTTGKSTVLRIPVPAVTPGGQQGEVTVSWIPQKRELVCLHGCIGITYRPPPSRSYAKLASLGPPATAITTPPVTPRSRATFPASLSTSNLHQMMPPSPPISPRSLRSVQSASTLLSLSPSFPRTPPNPCQPISLLFSPHGIHYAHLAPYVTGHLVAEAALPLTALLHCMDAVSNPWWLGGNICSGTLTGAEIANRLGARVWISAHDGEKEVRGLATGLLRTRRWGRAEVEGLVSPVSTPVRTGDAAAAAAGIRRVGSAVDKTTEVMRLGSGDEVVVTGDGMVLSAAPSPSTAASSPTVVADADVGWNEKTGAHEQDKAEQRAATVRARRRSGGRELSRLRSSLSMFTQSVIVG
jgi:hypothetical protein